MPPEKEIGALCEQLTSFLQHKRQTTTVCHRKDIHENRRLNCDKSSDYIPRSATYPTPFHHHHDTRPTTTAERKTPLLGATCIGLLQVYEILEASKGKEIKDMHIVIAAQTDIMDDMIEDELLGRYHDWILQKEIRRAFEADELAIWVQLEKEVRVDMNELALENKVMMNENEGQDWEWRGFRAHLVFVASEKDKSIDHPRMDAMKYDNIDRSLGISSHKPGSTSERDMRLLLGAGTILGPPRTLTNRSENRFSLLLKDEALLVAKADFQGFRDR